MRKKQIKLWGSAGLACFALMVSLGVDLSTISAEAENGGFFHLLAVNIKKLEYLLPVFTYRVFLEDGGDFSGANFPVDLQDFGRTYRLFSGVWI